MKKRFLWLLLWLVAGILLAWVLRTVSLADTWVMLRQLGTGQILCLIAMNALVLLIQNGRWWLILYGLGYKLPYLYLTGYRLAAFGLSYFTPGPLLGGEPLQAYLIVRNHAVPHAIAIAAVTLDKSLELCLNFTFLAIGVIILLQGQWFDNIVETKAVFFALIFLTLPLSFLAAIWAGWHPISQLLQMGQRLPFLQKRPKWQTTYQKIILTVRESETQAIRFCHESVVTLVLALFISSLGWITMIVEYWLMLSFLGVNLNMIQLIVALTAARVALLLLVPGGLGTIEASQVLVLSSMGFNPAAGMSVSLLIRVRDIILAITGLWWGSKKLQL
jgi:glycosyltransferase 2 family protein